MDAVLVKQVVEIGRKAILHVDASRRIAVDERRQHSGLADLLIVPPYLPCTSFLDLPSLPGTSFLLISWLTFAITFVCSDREQETDVQTAGNFIGWERRPSLPSFLLILTSS